MRYLFVTVLSVFIVGRLYAGLQPVAADDAVAIALKNNKEYLAAELRASRSEAALDEAWGAVLPVIESEASVTRQGAESGFMSLSDGDYSLKFIQMRLAVNPGFFYNNLEGAYKNRVLNREIVRQSREKIEYQVIESYFSVCRSNEILKLRVEKQARLEENYRDMQNLYKAGTVSKYDLLQAELQLKNAEPETIIASNNVESSVDQFNFVLGQETNVYTASPAGEMAIAVLPDDDKHVQMLVSAALGNRPEVVQVRLTGDILDRNRKAAGSYRIWPTFSFSGYYGMTKANPNPVDIGLSGPVQPDMSQITGDDKWQNTWQIKAAATYRWSSHLPWDSSNALTRDLQLRYNETELNQSAVKRTIYNSVMIAIRKVHTAYSMIGSRKSAVSTAEEGLRIAQTSFKAGVIKNTDLLSSETALTEAGTGYIQSLYDYYIAVALLKKETGIYDNNILFTGASQ